ncbi:T9SS type A sorting domain-containing protein [Crocinitomix catalasitica]|uniref:T9SS type A sorting domain-containing protein n=1 Tax=Crocinitomix catalasitica TaxID=184607 RepID=UPI000488A65B|nr:T9SS type A sorting domain-containing protein [Crocinitomix catalasitica]
MKKHYFIGLLILLVSNFSFGANRYWVAPGSGNWNDIANWSTTSGGAGGASFPTVGDFAYFDVNSIGDCNINIDAEFDGINTTGYVGTIEIDGFVFNPTVSGTDICIFASGTIQDTPGTSSVSYTTTNITYFSGTTFDVEVDVVSGRLAFNGGTFNEITTVEQTGGSNTPGTGGVTFNSTTSITNSGTAYLLFANASPDIFNGDLTLLNSGAGTIRLSQNVAGNMFDGDITVNSTDGGGIYFGDGGGTSTLSAGQTINIGVDGYNDGDLRFYNFTQLGATPIDIELTADAILRIGNSTEFGGAFTGRSPQIYVFESTFLSDVILEKTGSTNDYSIGGSFFEGDTELINSSDGYFVMGNGNPDEFRGDLLLNNVGTSHIYIAYNSAGNKLDGDLTANLTASSRNIYLSTTSISDFTIDGDVNILSNSDANSSNFYLGVSGDVTIGGRLDFEQLSTGDNAYFYIAQGTDSQVEINGVTHVVNNAVGVTKRFYLGENGDIVFNDSLIIENNSGSTNNEIYCNNSANSSNEYNNHILLTQSNIDGDGISFGRSGGNGTLATTKLVSISPDGFVAGQLRFENFTQLGATAQALTLSGDALLYLNLSEWGGEISFVSPRILTKETVYHEAASMVKSGSGNDGNHGGNLFEAGLDYDNRSTNYVQMGNVLPDSVIGDLNLITSGSSYIDWAYNSLDNYVSGDVRMDIIGTGAGVNRLLLGNATGSSLLIEGSVVVLNQGDAASNHVYIGNQGDVVIEGDLTIDHEPTGLAGTVYVANGTNSNVEINGNLTLTQAAVGGNTKNSFIGNNGDLLVEGILTIINNSDANSNEVICNAGTESVGVYEDDIIISSTDVLSDGVSFGTNGGTGTLAATKTITIGVGGFVAGNLNFRNFNQIGATAQTLNATGTTFFRNRDSDWGGDVNFVGGRMLTEGTLYRGTAYLEKSGGSSEISNGGNTFTLDAELKNSGDGYFYMGNVSPDVFNANLTMNNEGTSHLLIAYNSPGNIIEGDLITTNIATGAGGAYLTVSNSSISSIEINGDVEITNTGSAGTTNTTLGANGDVDIAGDLTVLHGPTGDNGYFYLASGTTSDVTIDGDFNLTVDATGGVTKRTYLANQGTIQYNGDFIIDNNGDATNNQIYCNQGATSTAEYNGNIVLSATSADADGISFGEGGGSAILADSYTVSLGGPFISGDLYFRNFTQDGPTAQDITITGTAYFRINNADWGGDVEFTGARMNTQDSRFRGLTTLEKTGGSSDPSAGGNVFDGDCILRNSGDAYFLMGNNNFDIWNGDLDVLNTGSDNMHIGYRSAGNIIEGDLSVTNSSTGAGTATIYLSNYTESTITVEGDATFENIGNTTTANMVIGDNGDINFNGDVTLINTPTGTSGDIRFANNTESTVNVLGNTSITNNGLTGTSKRMFIGYNGDIDFTGTVDISNTSDATYSEVSLNERGNSVNLYNDDIIINCDEVASDGVYFGRYGGTGSLVDTKTVSIGADGFIGGNLYFRAFTQIGGTAQTLIPTGADTRFESVDSEWNGNVDFRSAAMFTNGTTYNGNATLEKNGTTNDASGGGNIFNSFTILRNTGTGYFMPANGTGNDFNADVTYNSTVGGIIYPTYNSESTYAGDITVDSPEIVTFGNAGNGRVILDGVTAQTINAIGATPAPRFRDLQTLNTVDEITLSTPISVITELDLDEGNLISSLTNILTVTDNATVSSVSHDAYVDGPVEKVGNDIFTFPVGKVGYYRPIELTTAPSSGSATFRGEFFPVDCVDDGIPDGPTDPTIHHISDCEYWILDRLVTTNPVVVSLSYLDFDARDCSGVEEQADLMVARYTGSFWQDHGNGGTSGTPEDGWVSTLGAVTDFSPFTLATISGANPLPVELLSFDAEKQNDFVQLNWLTASEINNDYFDVERSNDGINYTKIAKVDGAGNSVKRLSYQVEDFNPNPGMNYYRLKQVDFDGAFEYSQVESVEFNDFSAIKMYPNPAGQNELLTLESSLPIQRIIMQDESSRVVNDVTFNGDETRVELNLNNLAKGIHFVQIYTSNGVSVKKVVIQ